MRSIRILSALIVLTFISCTQPHDPNKTIPAFLIKFPTNYFAHPIGEDDHVTEKNDWWDSWYNAQDFGENRHLGEDWNKITGGDTDCGEAVYSTADGEIVFAADAGPGWGNVIVI